jgi:predicted metalloprotease with PDZ domain
MLVAFIYDLSLRNLTKCRESLDDVYGKLFQLAATGQGSANEIIIKLLSEQQGLESFAKDYIESAGKIDLEAAVLPYGIQMQRERSGSNKTKLAVRRNPNKDQRILLSCIGNRK